jgi:hypothetical protein
LFGLALEALAHAFSELEPDWSPDGSLAPSVPDVLEA